MISSPFADTSIYQRSFISRVGANYQQHVCILKDMENKCWISNEFKVNLNLNKVNHSPAVRPQTLYAHSCDEN